MIMTKKQNDNKCHKDTYAIVGELVLIANALDYLLTQVVIEVLDLGIHPMLMPTIGTLDSVRKIEILKERNKHFDKIDFKEKLKSFLDNTEKVFKNRNIACHTPAVLESGKWSLKPLTMAKILKGIDVEKQTIQPFSFDDLQKAISTAEIALGEGANLITNFKNLNEKNEEKNEVGSASKCGY